MNDQKILRLTGMVGILAALTGFLAEMLLYGGFYSGAEYHEVSRRIMSEIPFTRLIFGGALGPIEAILYIIGFWHIYLAVKPGSSMLAKITFLGFSSSFIVGGAYHSAFVYTGLIIRAKNVVQAVDLPVLNTLLEQSNYYIHFLYYIGFGFAALGTIAFVVVILSCKTLYPKWIVIFTPQLIILVVPHIFRHIPAPVGGILYGGQISLSLLLFFCLSTIVLWNRLKESQMA